jgi:hypothetical protein
MTNFAVTLVDHGTNTNDKWRQGLRDEIQALFDLCIPPTTVHRVIVAWGTGTKTDNLVLHFVEDVDHSYIQAKMPGDPLKEYIGGHTRTSGKLTGTEFYRLVGMKNARAQYKYTAYAKVAVHESLHNLFPGWTEDDGRGWPSGVPAQIATDR